MHFLVQQYKTTNCNWINVVIGFKNLFINGSIKMITKMTHYYADGLARCGMNTAQMLWWMEDVIQRQNH